MTIRSLTGAALLALLGAGLPAAAADAPEPAVLRVLVVETVDLKAYQRELEALLKLERTVVPEATLHVWRARFAGADAGALVVTAELPGLSALAKIDELARHNPEFQATVKRIEALRRVISDSLYEAAAP